MKTKIENTTAIYCRVARKDDEALASQESLLRRYAEKNGYENVTVYSDNGYVGLNYDRPAFKQLQADIKSGKIRTVLVKDISRITRNGFDLHEWVFKHQQEKFGVKLISVLNDICMLDALQIDFREVIASMCKKAHSEKIKKGLARKKISAN